MYWLTCTWTEISLYSSPFSHHLHFQAGQTCIVLSLLKTDGSKIEHELMSLDMILTGSRSLQLILFSQLTEPETWDSSSNPSILLLSLCPVIKFIILPYYKLLLRPPLPTEPHSRQFLSSLLNYNIHTSLKPAWPLYSIPMATRRLWQVYLHHYHVHTWLLLPSSKIWPPKDVKEDPRRPRLYHTSFPSIVFPAPGTKSSLWLSTYSIPFYIPVDPLL